MLSEESDKGQALHDATVFRVYKYTLFLTEINPLQVSSSVSKTSIYIDSIYIYPKLSGSRFGVQGSKGYNR